MRLLRLFSCCFVILSASAKMKKSDLTIDGLSSFIQEKKIQNLDDIPSQLPGEFMINFILKHGREIEAPRGHLPEHGDVDGEVLGQQATPLSPRAIVFDLDSGFTISYNGGGKICTVDKIKGVHGKDISCDGKETDQENSHTLDMMEFDQETHKFIFEKWDLIGKDTNKNNKNCAFCHGAGEKARPVYSMYPDWPGFYGSDNDELTNPNMVIVGGGYTPAITPSSDYQKNEFKDFLEFRRLVRESNLPRYKKRYAPLFDERNIRENTGFDNYVFVEPAENRRYKIWGRVSGGDYTDPFSKVDYPLSENFVDSGFEWLNIGGRVAIFPWDQYYALFPFRPTHTYVSTRDISKAFTFRPGLRFNILMSRYHTLNLKRQIINHKNFEDIGKFFLFNTMMCSSEPENKVAIDKWFNKAGELLGENLSTGNGIRVGNPLYVNEGNRFSIKEDASEHEKIKLLEYGRRYKLFDLEIRDVDMRYSRYRDEYDYENYPTNGPLKIGYFGSGIYFNSYNDGSVTTDELITAQIAQHLAKNDPSFIRALRKHASNVTWSYREKVIEGGGHTIRDGKISISGREVSTTNRKKLFVEGSTSDQNVLNTWNFASKYGKFPARYTIDKDYYAKMDAISGWINLPYDPYIGNEHHRVWWSSGKKFWEVYSALCNSLEDSLVEDSVKL